MDNNQLDIRSVDKKIGRTLRNLRISACLTQVQIAEILGVTFQQVQKYETGTNRLSTSRLLLLCKAFSITPDKFLEELL